MSTPGRIHRLGGPLYQILVPPPRLASEANVVASIRMDALKRIPERSFGWMKLPTIVYPPFRGGSRAAPDFRGPTAVEAYAGTLAALAVGLALVLSVGGWSLNGSASGLLVLAALAIWAERQHVQISENLGMTVSVLPTLFAAAAFGPLDAMVVAAAGLGMELGRAPHARWIVWTSQRCIGAGAAGLIVSAVAADATLAVIAAFVILAAAAEAAIDIVLGVVTLTVRRSGSRTALLRSLAPITLATVPLYGPVVAILAYAHKPLGFWVLAVFLSPLIGIQALYRVFNRERAASRDLKETNARLERATVSFASALVSALDARDAYTAGHSAAVAVYARDIARRLGLSQEEQQRAHLAGLLHDIGKVGLPPGLLEKAGVLTSTERTIMQQHSSIGERILRKVDDYATIATIVRHHHERLDGGGYPDRLRGNAIPLISRIIAVADAYNAMTSGRPYRRALSTEEARRRLRVDAGSQFDPEVVGAFESLLMESAVTYVQGVSPDFTLDAQCSRPSLHLQVSAA